MWHFFYSSATANLWREAAMACLYDGLLTSFPLPLITCFKAEKLCASRLDTNSISEQLVGLWIAEWLQIGYQTTWKLGLRGDRTWSHAQCCNSSPREWLTSQRNPRDRQDNLNELSIDNLQSARELQRFYMTEADNITHVDAERTLYTRTICVSTKQKEEMNQFPSGKFSRLKTTVPPSIRENT